MDIDKAQTIASLVRKMQYLSAQIDGVPTLQQKITEYILKFQEVPEEVRELHQAALLEKIEDLARVAQRSMTDLLGIFQEQLQQL